MDIMCVVGAVLGHSFMATPSQSVLSDANVPYFGHTPSGYGSCAQCSGFQCQQGVTAAIC